jgi:hypothetical protein
MSTAGTYAYWPKVNNPKMLLGQMKSEGQKKPFFFGGSQVPTALGIKVDGVTKGSGVFTGAKHLKNQMNLKNHVTGNGLSNTARKNNPIKLARHVPSIVR